ncbi:MAG: PKD domain-containing protein [Cytophagaceae bacterium]
MKLLLPFLLIFISTAVFCQDDVTPPPPAAPTIGTLDIDARTRNISLSWNLSSGLDADAIRYELQIVTPASSNFPNPNSNPGSVHSTTNRQYVIHSIPNTNNNNNLIPNTEYKFRVRSIGAGTGESSISAWVEGTATTSPTAPTNLALNNSVLVGSIGITWDAPANGAHRYEVYVSENEDFSNSTAYGDVPGSPIDGTSYTINTLTANKTLYIRVRSFNSQDVSSVNYSNVITVTNPVVVYLFSTNDDNRVCSGENITLIASPSTQAGLSYRFYLNGSSQRSNTDLTRNRFTTSQTQAFDVRVVVRHGSTEIGTAELRININNLPPKPVYTGDTEFYVDVDPYELPFSEVTGPNSGDIIQYFSGPAVIEDHFHPRAFYPLTDDKQVTIVYTRENEETGCKDTLNIPLTIINSALPDWLEHDRPLCTNYFGLEKNIYIDASEVGDDHYILNVSSEPPGAIQRISPVPSHPTQDIERTYRVYPYINNNNVIRLFIEVVRPNHTPSNPSIFYDTTAVIISQPRILFLDDLSSQYCSNNQDTIRLRRPIPGGTFTYYRAERYGTQVYPTYPPLPPDVNEGNDSTFVPYKIEEFVNDDENNILYSWESRPKEYFIQYTVPGGDNCPASGTKSFYMKKAPLAEFTVTTPQPFCDQDDISFTNLSETVFDQPNSYTWFFGNGTTLSNNSGGVITSTYNAREAEYDVRLRLTLQDGSCPSEAIRSFRVGSYPDINFSAKHFCQGDSTRFEDKTINLNVIDTIKHYAWTFSDLSSENNTSTLKDPAHRYQNPGLYTIKLNITNEYGCSSSLKKKVPVFPMIDLTQTSYITSFNTKDGWISCDELDMGRNSSWSLKTPEGLNINNSFSGKSWITAKDTTMYHHNENSWVESPCFDLSQIEDPMVMLRTWFLTEEDRDGAVLQYTASDSAYLGQEEWRVVGVNEGHAAYSGENWYNKNYIIARPGDQGLNAEGQPTSDPDYDGFVYGWSGTSMNEWTFSKYALGNVKNASEGRKIRFRMAFASDASNFPGHYEGFAFDDFFVGRRNRTVLIEHFTNLSSQEARTESLALDGQLPNLKQIDLRYHTSFPGEDQINKFNTADPSARALHYGIPAVPRTVIDGIEFENAAYSSGWGEQAYNRRTLLEAPFDVTIAHALENGEIKITTRITKIESLEGPFNLQIAIVEDPVYVAGNNTPHRNVVRKLIPNAAGNRIEDANWQVGTSKEIIRTWRPTTEHSGNLKVVAFIQDENTREVYQAAVIDLSEDEVNSLSIESNSSRFGTEAPALQTNLYPNPANHAVHVSFDRSLEENYQYAVYNSFGRLMMSGVVVQGSIMLTLPTDQLTPGMYHLHLSNGKDSLIKEKMTIVR